MQLIGEALAAVRGERIVFRNVSFKVVAGEALNLHGPNGSGKTTLLRVIAGLLGTMAGRLQLLDGQGKQLADDQRDQSFHFVSHQDAIRSQLRVQETLRFQAALLGAPASNVDAALETWGLAKLAGLSGGLLSAGQRRRLSLARLSLQKRNLWLLDEPTVALDMAARAHLFHSCTEHLDQGGLIVTATHESFLGDPKCLQLGPRE
jgi:heme exporter protein A